jgi:thiamine pyrophosphate-dependent acetolactate synthase large subunit-like protein
VIGEPYLGNREATAFPKPWVKWSYEPARAEDVPGLDLPGFDVAALARGSGCRAADVETAEALEQEFKTALTAGGPSVIVVRTQPQKALL